MNINEGNIDGNICISSTTRISPLEDQNFPQGEIPPRLGTTVINSDYTLLLSLLLVYCYLFFNLIYFFLCKYLLFCKIAGEQRCH